MKVSQIVYLIVSAIISFITAYLGALIIIQTKENLLIGILAILLGFLLLFFSFYTLQIKTNQDEINDIKKELNEINKNIKDREKLINTIKDVVLIKGMYKDE